MDVFDLEAFIRLNVDEYLQELDAAEKESQKTGSKLASIFGGAAKAITAGMAAAGAGIVKIGKEALDAYANYEQLVGGVETLFGTGGQSLSEYAASLGKTEKEVEKEYNALMKSQETVLQNAAYAYQSAGMSANDYMETVTSFSASLLQSLGGDTQAAAALADQAIIDMSDNANKMGSDISSIQNAYSGFAKQNYTMLDNLKLGYGGTKEEMERLLQDADKLSDSFNLQKDKNGALVYSYADIINAIHIIQDEMNITDTTKNEAATTIQGSLSSLSASWQNLLVGIADDTQPFDKLVNNFVTAIDTVGDNILPRVEIILDGVVKLIDKLAPKIIKRLPDLINSILPGILDAATGIWNALAKEAPAIIKTLVKAITDNIDDVIDAAINITEALINGLLDSLPLIIDGLVTLIMRVSERLPEIIDKLVKALPGAIKLIINAIVKNLPVIIEGLVTLMLEIINALPEIINYLLDELPTIIQMVVDGLMENLPALIGGLVMMCTAIAQRLPEIIAGIIAALPEIVSAILSGLGPLGEGIAALFGPLTSEVLGPILTTAGNLLSDVFGGIALLLTDPQEALSRFWDWFQEKAEKSIRAVWDLLTGLFQLIPALIDEAEAEDRNAEQKNRTNDLIASGQLIRDANGNLSVNNDYMALQNGAGVAGGETATVEHTGTIRFEGVNNNDEFVASTDYVIQQMRRESRMGYGN